MSNMSAGDFKDRVLNHLINLLDRSNDPFRECYTDAEYDRCGARTDLLEELIDTIETWETE